MRTPSLTRRCRHRLGALTLALAAGFALAEDAARVDFAAGEATVITAAGESRALKKGEMITGGDRIETGRGRVQLRFADGAYVALQPNTVFRVDQYLYANQPAAQQSAFFSLVKGGMRTVTGTIGKANRDNYKVKTPVATIGIRGTGYSALQTASQLLVSVNTGMVAVLNELGESLAGAGQNIAVTPDHQPGLTTEQVHFNGGEEAADDQGESSEETAATDEAGAEEQTAVADSEVSSEVVVADASYSPELNSCPDTTCNSIAAIEKAIGQPIQSAQPLHLIVARNGLTAKGNYFEQGSDKLVVTAITNSTTTAATTTATIAATTASDTELLRAELENSGVLSNYLSRDSINSPWAQEPNSWRGSYIHGGSWNNGQYQFLTSTNTLTGGQFLHYVGGELAPVATIDSLVTKGAKLDYTLIGASSANNAAGTKNLFLDSSSLLRVNFLTSQMSVYLKLTDSSFQPINYIIDNAGNIQWQTYNPNSHDARFTLSLTGSNHTSCSTCNTNITGFFAGPNADEVGIGYTVLIPTLSDTFEGAAGFGSGGATVPQGLFITYASPTTALGPKYYGEYVASGQPVFHPIEDANGLLTGDQAGVIKLTRDANHVGTGAAQQTVNNITNGLHWGSWGPGDYRYDNNGSPTTVTLGTGQRLHYVYGDLTSLADMATLAQNNSLKISYGFAGATAVTDPAGTLAAGTLDPASGFKFNFGLGTIDAHLVFNNFAGVTSSVVDNSNVALNWGSNTSPGGPATDARFNVTVLDSSCVSVCSQTATLVGFFSGPNAQALGVAYNAILGGNNATGAAAFTRVPTP